MKTKNFNPTLRAITRCVSVFIVLLFQRTELAAQLPDHVSPAGLQGWYNFESGTQDLSMFQRHASPFAAQSAPDRFDAPNNAYYFNGQNSLIEIEHHLSHNSLPFTISLWMKPDGIDGGGPLISKGTQGFEQGWKMEVIRGGNDGDAIRPSYALQSADMNEACECGCQGVFEGEGDCGSGINYTGNIFDDQWHLVTFVVDDVEGRLYLDGELVTQQLWAGDPTGIYNTNNIVIGAFRNNDGPWDFFNGFIDDVGIWSRALDANEVAALFTEEPLPLQCNMFDPVIYENIVGHWPFCGNAEDESSNDFHGVIAGAELTEDAMGNAESAYHFDNTSIELPVEVNWLNGDFTIHLESRMLEFADEYPTIVSCAGLTIQYATTCEPYCLNVYLRGDGYEFGHMAIPIDFDQWNTITVKREGQLFFLYLNGIALNIVEIDPNAVALSDTHMTLGYTASVLEGYEGELDNVAMWTRSLTDVEIWDISDASGFIVFGCTDPSACNYEPLATMEDWSCGYMSGPCNDGNPNTINDTFNELCDCEGMWGDWEEGCTDPMACNFDWLALVDDGTCLYPGSTCTDGDSTTTNTLLNWWCECVEQVNCNDPWAYNFFPNAIGTDDCLYAAEIITFEDVNANGLWDANETSLGNWPLAIFGSDSTIYTDAYGYVWTALISLNGEPVASDSIYDEWHNTTPLAITTDWGWPVGVWGFVNTNPEGVSVNISQHMGWPPIIHCDSGLDVGAYITNTGSEPVNAVVTITCSDTLQYAPNTTPAIVSLSADTLVIDHISSYNFELASFHIDSPGMEFLDDFFDITICVAVFDSAGNAVSDTCFLYSTWVACSYDPNDLTAYSPGHYEPHFLPAGERVMFRVRFQNTGNYFAEDVLIRDVLDPAVWDISTFEPAMASVGGVAYEGVQSNLNPLTGEVSFLFDGIQLPDSSMSQELSQGFVTFYVNIRNELTHGTELSNTAEIYFDNNPAIVTNTTQHTVFDCSTLNGLPAEVELCEGESLDLNASQPWVDSYDWNVAGENYNSSELNVDALGIGEHSVTLQLTNPMCVVDYETTARVIAVPDNTVDINGSLLSVNSGDSWQWYFEGSLLSGEEGPTLQVQEEGVYTVLISQSGACESTGTARYIASGLAEQSAMELAYWPNPMQQSCRLHLPDARGVLKLYDAFGQLVREEDVKGPEHVLQRGELASGFYQLVVHVHGDVYHAKLIIE